MPLHTDSKKAAEMFVQGTESPDVRDALDRLQEITETPEFQNLAADAARHFGAVVGNEALVLNASSAVADAISETAAEVPVGTERPLAEVIDSLATKLKKQDDGWDEFPAPKGLDLHG